MKNNLLSLSNLILKNYSLRLRSTFRGFFRETIRFSFAHLSWAFSFVIISASVITSNAQIRIVADLNTSDRPDESSPERDFSSHVSAGNRSFFIASQYYGHEVWTSDGTEEGTVLLKFSRQITELETAGGIAFFAALSDEHGVELWKSDGTPEGTVLLKDIYPGIGSSSPSSLTNVNGVLFFAANNKTHGRELWKSDGTPGGTQLVKDVKVGSESSGVSRITAFQNNALFVANDGVTGYELWKSDGTGTGTSLLADIHPSGNSSPSDITVAGSVAFFAAEAPMTNRQLYKTDGTTSGTSLVKVIRPGNYNAKIARITAVNSTVFFEAFDGVHGSELWKSDGTAAGTILVKDITPGPGSQTTELGAHIDHAASVDGKLFFTAVAEYHTRDLWVSDGTAAGTFVIEHTSSFYVTTDPGITQINGEAYFLVMGAWSDNLDLIKSNGVSTTLVKNQFAYCGCHISTSEMPRPDAPHMRAVNGEYYFFAGTQYWKTDGTEEGTVLIRDLTFKGGIRPTQLVDLNGTLLFDLEGFDAAPEGFWRSNGTPETTVRISYDYLENLTAYNGVAYFGGPGSDFRRTVYRSDGTSAGTFELSDDAKWPGRFTGSGGLMFFHAQGPGGSELYKTDGTPAGTSMVKDIFPGPDHSHPLELTDVGGTLFFTAETVGAGRELWKSDGTEAGTTFVKDIWPGSTASNIRYPVFFQGQLYFQANDGTNGTELWRSNGTPEGTVRVTDFGGSLPNAVDLGPMLKSNGLLYFTSSNGIGTVSLWRLSPTSLVKLRDFAITYVNSLSFLRSPSGQVLFLLTRGDDSELWRSNGTASGTISLKRFRNTTIYGTTAAVRGNVSYFGFGGTVWRSDGSIGGTYSLPFYGDASHFTTSGPYVYFYGTSTEYGSELFLIEEESTSATSVSLASAIGEEKISSFPNPFRSTVTVRVNGPESSAFEMNVLDAKGQEISSNESLLCNTDHHVGSSWKAGVYMLRIREGNKISTRKVIKTMD